jgi:hypothetical protein
VSGFPAPLLACFFPEVSIACTLFKFAPNSVNADSSSSQQRTRPPAHVVSSTKRHPSHGFVTITSCIVQPNEHAVVWCRSHPHIFRPTVVLLFPMNTPSCGAALTLTSSGQLFCVVVSRHHFAACIRCMSNPVVASDDPSLILGYERTVHEHIRCNNCSNLVCEKCERKFESACELTMREPVHVTLNTREPRPFHKHHTSCLAR